MRSLNKELVALLEEHNPTSYPIREGTRLYQDLNIYGDDAEEFLLEYAKTFNVDVREFKLSEYFPGEGDEIIPDFCDR